MKVVFEDKEIIVVEKSAGEVVHSAPGYEDGTMSDLLKVRYPDRLRFTPHTAWASKEAKARLVHLVAENIRRGW